MISANSGVFATMLPPDRILRAVSHAELAALIDAATWSRLVQLCESFPAGVQTVCFECRLAADDPRVDLAFCLMPGPQLPRLSEAVRAAKRASSAWTRFADFLDAWSGVSAPWSTQVPFVCPAFDLDEQTTELPPPCLSVCVDAEFYARRLGIASGEVARIEDILALAADCHARLTGADMPAATLTLLRGCLETGLDVEPKHMSWMLSRPHAPMKLDVRMPARQLAPFLARIHFPVSIDPLLRRVGELVDGSGDVQLNLVLHPDLGPCLELELFSVASDTTAQRFALLDRLVDFGIASAPKANVLRATWLQPKCKDEAGLILAKSWYIKLRFGEHERCDAKAYLGLMPRLLQSPVR